MIQVYFNFYPLKDGIDAISKLQKSSLELSMTPTDGETKFFVGNWAKLKVIPTNDDFYTNFR